MIGQTISHYRIIEKLGGGGMGVVYLAEDTRLNRKVAIKFLPAEVATDERAKQRLLREAKTAATLDHPNICSIYEVGEEDSHSFIILQYIEGETLAARLKRHLPDLREALAIAPSLFRWSVEKTGYDPLFVQPHAINGTHDVVGASTHGALYFVSEHHSADMTVEQNICLAHFSISEATKHDLRLGLPVEFAVIGRQGCFQFAQTDVPQVVNASEAIARAIREQISKPGPVIDLEALRSSRRGPSGLLPSRE